MKSFTIFLVDLLILHLMIKLLFGKYKNLIEGLSKMSVPINFAPLQKNKDYNIAGTLKILLLFIAMLGLIVLEYHLFY